MTRDHMEIQNEVRRERETEDRIRKLDWTEIVQEIHALEDSHDGLLEALERSHGWNLKILAGIKSGKIPDQTMLYSDGTDQTLSDALDEVIENNAAAIKAAR